MQDFLQQAQVQQQSAPQQQQPTENKFNQLSLESGEMLEPEEDLMDESQMGGQESDVASVFQQGLGDEDFQLLNLYMTPELNNLLTKLFGEMIPAPVKQYFDSITNPSSILVPIERSKVEEQMTMGEQDMAAQPTNSESMSGNNNMDMGSASTETPAPLSPSTEQPVVNQ